MSLTQTHDIAERPKKSGGLIINKKPAILSTRIRHCCGLSTPKTLEMNFLRVFIYRISELGEYCKTKIFTIAALLIGVIYFYKLYIPLLSAVYIATAILVSLFVIFIVLCLVQFLNFLFFCFF